MSTSIAPSDTLPLEEEEPLQPQLARRAADREQDIDEESRLPAIWSRRALSCLAVVFAAAYVFIVVYRPQVAGASLTDDVARIKGKASDALGKEAITLQMVTLELAWSDPFGRCLTVKGGRNATGTPVILQRCVSSHLGQRFSIERGLVRWEQYAGLCLSSRKQRSREFLAMEICDHTKVGQLWVLQGSSPHPALNASLCVDAVDKAGARAELVPCSRTKAPTPLPTPFPTPAPTPVDLSWQCHRYAEDQSNKWCQTVGSSYGVEYRFFGKNSPCGECWCCKRHQAPVEMLQAPGAIQVLTDVQPSAPMVEIVAKAAPSSAWGCYRYDDSDSQDERWCRSVGTLGGMEYGFFGEGGPCGECWCCVRPQQEP